MENNENNPQNSQNCSSSNPDKSCCSTLFTKDDQGNKKLSLLSWSILLVLLIGAIGIISSNKDNQRKLVANTNEAALQLQRESDALQDQAKVKLKAKEQKESKISSAKEEEAVVNKLKELQDRHNKQMEQAQKAFDSLKSAYAQKLNEVVKDMQAQQEAKEQEVPNPELNFQLRGLSNVKVQFNKSKDISYIEIIQPENCKSYKNKKKDKSDCCPNKYKNCEDKGKMNWGDCEKTTYSPAAIEQKEYKNYNKWDCKPQDNKRSDCGTY